MFFRFYVNGIQFLIMVSVLFHFFYSCKRRYVVFIAARLQYDCFPATSFPDNNHYISLNYQFANNVAIVVVYADKVCSL